MEITGGVGFQGSEATMKRILACEVANGNILVSGVGRATRYMLSSQAHITMPLNLDTYFAKDIEDREIQEGFNHDLICGQLPKVDVFSAEELDHLNGLQQEFRMHADEMTENEYRKEMERLGIDLSWKSSQIEGNMYSLHSACPQRISWTHPV